MALLGNVNCGAPVTPVAAPAPSPASPQQQPQCFAQLKDRPVNDPNASAVDAVHSFWWVQGDIDGVSEDFILTAGPIKSSGSTTSYLNAFAVPGSAVPNSADNSSQHTDWTSGSSSSLCSQVDSMISAAQNFPNNTIPYSPYAAGVFGGPNSNSAAHYFATVGLFFNATPAATAYGWNVPLLGLLP
jgi:hypothetical protein